MYFYDYPCAMDVESLLYEYLNVCQMLSGCGCEVIKYKQYLERSRIFVRGLQSNEKSQNPILRPDQKPNPKAQLGFFGRANPFVNAG